MEYIRGKFKQMIFESDNGYKVGLFRVKEASGEMEEYVNKTITFTGYFADVDDEEDFCVRKIDKDNDDQLLVGLDSDAEFDRAMLLFMKKNKGYFG